MNRPVAHTPVSQPFSLEEAAHQMGTTRARLIARLRQQGWLQNGKPLPTQVGLATGWLRVEHRTLTLPGTTITRHYAVTVITPDGLAACQQLINATQESAA